MLRPLHRQSCPKLTAPLCRSAQRLVHKSQPKDAKVYPPASKLAKYWDTIPPTPAQLQYAESFFSKQPPKFLWSAPKFHSMDYGDSPEVCFLGRSNVGKSSLLNALLGQQALAHVSSKPGRTKEMNAFAVGGDQDNGKNRLVVLDMPGYGKGGRSEWGTEIMKYLGQRKQLKRAFLLIDANVVDPKQPLKATDEQLLQWFREKGIPHQIILSKVDKMLFVGTRYPNPSTQTARLLQLSRVMDTVKQAVQPDVEDEAAALGEIVSCSSDKVIGGKRLGIPAVRHAMLQAAGLEYRPITKPVGPIEIVPHSVLMDDHIHVGFTELPHHNIRLRNSEHPATTPAITVHSDPRF